jgi:uncharacterized protein (UPF0332 family)
VTALFSGFSCRSLYGKRKPQYSPNRMAKKPPVAELEFLKLSGNHLELDRKLSSLGCETPDIFAYAQHVCEAWFRLGEKHLTEAKLLVASGCNRAGFSRAYYAAYNASKAARYIKAGFVSLKGDDHAAASTALPGDFPDVAKWSMKISALYEHRLWADYDNWVDTEARFTLKPTDAVADAAAFIDETRAYLNSKCGMNL